MGLLIRADQVRFIYGALASSVLASIAAFMPAKRTLLEKL